MTTTTIARRRSRTFTHTGVITRRNLLTNVCLPDVLLLSTIQPVVFILMFLYVFGGAIQAALPAAAPGEADTHVVGAADPFTDQVLGS
jgi:hypothetical protein